MSCNCHGIARDVRGYGEMVEETPVSAPRPKIVEGLLFGLGVAIAAKLVEHFWPGKETR